MLGGHWWSESIQVPAMIPELGWFPTPHSTIADKGLCVPAIGSGSGDV